MTEPYEFSATVAIKKKHIKVIIGVSDFKLTKAKLVKLKKKIISDNVLLYLYKLIIFK